MNDLKISLNYPQAQFLAMPQKFKAFVAGFGSGKTWVGCSSLGKHFLEFPRVNAGYFAPTYAQIRDIFYPTVDEALFPWGFTIKLNEGNKEVHLYQGRRYYGTIICRSMEKPETIIGFKIGKALVDEIDVLKSDKAKTAWRKIIARLRWLREGLQNGIDVTTTPEGFKFVYQQFVEQLREKPELAAMYGLIQASTYDNEANLPADYIPSLLASYPAQLIDAYIDGQFVNLKTGSVYVAYNRKENACDDVIQPQETLFIGLDFNVGHMSGVVHVLRNGLPRAVDEIVNGYDTPDVVRIIKERYWQFQDGKYQKSRQIRIYPDASGSSRKSVNASETDLAILRQEGFQVIVDHSNPPVKDRINSMNAMFCNAKGERRYLVNPHKCPTYAACLEQQAWADNGEPDKTTGHDHCFSGDTMVHTRNGVFRFDQLPATGEVIGPFGDYVPYHSARLTGNKITIRIDFDSGLVLNCTPDHQFLTGDGKWIQAKDLTGRECVLSVKQFRSSWESGIIEAVSISQIQQRKRIAESIRLSGLNITGKLAAAFKSITKIKTALTTRLKTSNGFNPSATCQGMESNSANESQKWVENTSHLQKNGTLQTLAENGTSSNTSAQKTVFNKHIKRFAQVVARFSKQNQASKIPSLSSVLRRAKQTIGGKAGLTTLIESAQNAGRRLPRTDTARVVSVSPVHRSKKEGVYCLTVPGYECFQIAPGLPIVSNCNDAGGYFIFQDYPIIKRTVTTSSGW